MSILDPLLGAIRSGDVSQVRKLLEADPSLAKAKTEGGVSVLLFAIYHRHWDIVHLIRRYLRRLNIHEAAAIGDLVELRRHLQARPTLADAYAPDGFTPLGLASFFGHYEAAEELIHRGASVDRPADNTFKVRPLHSAVAIGNISLVRLLLRRGAEVNATQQDGITPLHSAAYNGRVDMVELLLTYGADPNALTDKNETALDLAEARGHWAVVARLHSYTEPTR
ncbi:MAG: ankyrin repeat domain-containing protein [Bacteroidetes bacterium]|nr:MAG: ankyrin repeat domain-containing protein [Bacteroidota bacterium]